MKNALKISADLVSFMAVPIRGIPKDSVGDKRSGVLLQGGFRKGGFSRWGFRERESLIPSGRLPGTRDLRFVQRSRNILIISMGTGKMMVEFFSDPISFNVCR